MEENNKTWILMARVLSGEAGADDQAEFQHIMDSDPVLQQKYEQLKTLWSFNENNGAGNFISQQEHNSLENILKKGNDEYLRHQRPAAPAGPEPERSRAYLKYAAAIALVSVSLWLLFIKKNTAPVQYSTKEKVITVQNGKMNKVILPDGTMVWLNAGSKLFYPEHFNGKIRKVRLIGEAFFDVHKDKKHPFIVSTPLFNLKVLGTAFNVSAYPNDLSSEAALVRGKIEVTLIKQPDKRITLKPAEKLTIRNSYSSEQKEPKGAAVTSANLPLISLSNIHLSIKDTLPSEALWIENKLVFDGETFDNIARKMERRYNVSILFKTEEIKAVTFTGKFKNESINKALQSLQSIENFHYTIKNDQVTIY